MEVPTGLFARVGVAALDTRTSVPLGSYACSWFLRMRSLVWLTLRVKLCGRGPRAEADAARRLPHVSRRAAGGVPPPALVS